MGIRFTVRIYKLRAFIADSKALTHGRGATKKGTNSDRRIPACFDLFSLLRRKLLFFLNLYGRIAYTILFVCIVQLRRIQLHTSQCACLRFSTATNQKQNELCVVGIYMERHSKTEFQYATLFDPESGTYCTDGSQSGLVMGPETAKRFEQNDDCAVTICCITYKHEDYIRSALDGFLMQKTNFKYKVFVGEDCGPDKTADIVREYAEKYPDIIIPFIREKNMGAQANLIDLCKHANSPYIAFCEGDDYWVDENKLQKQYDYMQAHKDLRVCYTRAEISAPEDWFLSDWFKKNKEGKMIFPDCEPYYKLKTQPLDCSEFVWTFAAHTATVFYRWNYDLNIPDWYFTGIVGDHPIFLMQLGEGLAGFLPDVTAIYRRSNVGVYMSSSMDEHFLKTRLDHVRWMTGILEWYRSNQKKYPEMQFENRIKLESYNYLKTAIKLNDYDAIMYYFKTYPKTATISLNAYLSFYNDSRSLIKACTWEGYKLIARTRIFRYPLRLYAIFAKVVAQVGEGLAALYKKAKYIFYPLCYWLYTLVPKNKSLWVITSFRGNGYLDNTKYFYEYVTKHHPEIDIRWLTNSDEVYEQLKAEGKPVCKSGTKEFRRALSHAQVAVTDHFTVSDYSPLQGFNDKTKVVQLWHGVGFKSMGDASGVKNTSERGVQYSMDIIALPEDGFFTRIWKKIKYFFIAPFRERFEKYFLFVCPGQERLDMIADVWHIPHENCFMAGHPRDLPMYSSKRQESPVKIMYAPTYRFDYAREQAMVQEFLDTAPQIQALMEKIDGQFYLRMHPHTWRSYSAQIDRTLKRFDRIFVHSEKDVYQEIGTFSIMISDYSSIALDFALLDRPVIFHGADYNWFVKNEAGFNLDFPRVIPGPMTANWAETLQCVEEYYNHPDKDTALREEKLKYFFDKSVNGPDNSERIVQEIKNRIGLSS